MIATTGAHVVVFGVYFFVVARWLASTAADQVVYQPLLVFTVVPLVVLTVISHIAFAVLKPKEAGAHDERDALIALRGGRVGGYVLAVGAFAGIALAMAESSPFYIAHALLLAWVLAEVTDGTRKIVLYRRGA
ncbi:MAG TPA: hypothetical protein VNO31_30240 [Umezawaea sp.]|nr:hypothetical protein [Umezawaea sp.]